MSIEDRLPVISGPAARSNSTSTILLVVFLAIVAAFSGAFAQEFQVNTTTADNQLYPSVSVAPDGSFVIVWQHRVPDPVAVYLDTTYGQRFASDGSPLGGEFLIVGDEDKEPHVSHGSDGSFVVAWRHGSGSGARGQLFDAAGTPTGAELTVDPQFVKYPRLDHLGNGRFAAVTEGVNARVFEADGSLVGSELNLHGDGAGAAYRPDVAALPANRSFVVWAEGNSDGDSFGIWGAVLDPDGFLLGDEFLVNSYTTGSQHRPRIDANASGQVLAVWESSLSEIRARLFDSTGRAVGDDFQVNTLTTDNQVRPDVAVAADGSSMVVWLSDTSTGSDQAGSSIQGRRFAVDGTPLEQDLQINSTTAGNAGGPAVAASPSGEFVITWWNQSSPGDDNDGTSILARVDPPDSGLFFDGFESGGLGAWSETSGP